MESAETFERHDDPGAKGARGELDRIGSGHLLPLRSHGHETRAALRAGVWLRVEATVERIVVLAPAVVAHVKAGHGGPGAVVRRAGDDRIARAAVRAVGERIAIPPVRRIENVAQAVVARG